MTLVQLRRSADHVPPQIMTGGGEPKSLWLQITSKCNMTCSYCYMNATRDSHEALTFEQIQDVFAKAKRLGVKTMLISGGEPTIVKRLPDILRSSRLDYGFKTALVTNGSGIGSQARSTCGIWIRWSISATPSKPASAATPAGGCGCRAGCRSSGWRWPA